MTCLAALPGYETLASVLDDALAQSQAGKGAERHSTGQAFVDQPIVRLNEGLGSIDGQLFQVLKKAQESERMNPAAARRELLGAIVYLAAAVIQIVRSADDGSAAAPLPRATARHTGGQP
ncbi:MAG TPA: hypothetical protein VFQ42_21895 [Mycobacterium sp.]|nr:hypothetical protein [Mycobacterium sp.]